MESLAFLCKTFCFLSRFLRQFYFIKMQYLCNLYIYFYFYICITKYKLTFN